MSPEKSTDSSTITEAFSSSGEDSRRNNDQDENASSAENEPGEDDAVFLDVLPEFGGVAECPLEEAENPKNDWQCEHLKLGGFRELYGNSFTKALLEDAKSKRVNFPENCALCKKKFVGCGYEGNKESETKVTNRNSVWACCNAALRPDHACTFAYCNACYQRENVENPAPLSPRKPKRRRVYG